MEILRLPDIMEMLGIGKEAATKLLMTKGCPLLPRTKGCTYLVPKEPFLKWLASRTK